MYINSFRVVNFKSFSDSQEISLSPGFNVIVGQNNVGKTALLQAMTLQQISQPHRSLATMPTTDVILPPESVFHVSFKVGFVELEQILRYHAGQFYIPMLQNDTAYTALNRFFRALGTECTIDATWVGQTLTRLHIAEYKPDPRANNTVTLMAYNATTAKFDSVGGSFGLNADMPYLSPSVGNTLRSRIYMFQSERYNMGQSVTGTSIHLSPNAANLPEVLHNLVSIPAKFRAFRDAVRVVFPQILDITTELVSNAVARILLWSEDPELGRKDLAVPLAESGTGIGQVLAILYVILNSQFPQTILIDEPQSFLHPGAIRKLFEIMSQHPEHQYIITSHSPTAVTAADPKSLLIVRKEGTVSMVEEVDPSQTEHLRLYLRDIGARLSDVFGADTILWVEGPTEERCFPMIVRDLLKRPLMGTLIRGVIAVGDLERKDAGRVWEIYERLSSAGGLLPPALGFIFDREERDDGKRADLERASKGRISFLNRRMYESYLNDPEAIAAVMRDIPDFSEEPVTAGDIAEWLQEHRWDKRFVSRTISEDERSDEVWHQLGDAARLLTALFNEKADNPYPYHKVTHGTILTGWFIANRPEELSELKDLLDGKLSMPDGG